VEQETKAVQQSDTDMAKKSKDMRKMSDEDLVLEAREIKRRLFDLRTQQATEKIADTSQFRKMRKNIARLLTERNARRRKAEVSK